MSGCGDVARMAIDGYGGRDVPCDLSSGHEDRHSGLLWFGESLSPLCRVEWEQGYVRTEGTASIRQRSTFPTHPTSPSASRDESESAE